ncbi:MAG: hypothetical protein GVY30_08365 [Chloroflexi bacterium]|jgi:hypothetical protein|nr:hypothetical protein [Chloroflexota bacterium]
MSNSTRRLVDRLKEMVLFYQNTNDHNRFVAYKYEGALIYVLDMLHRPDSIEDLKAEIVTEIESALQERPIHQNHYYPSQPTRAKELSQ